jgi:hypothetical protein
MRVQSRGMVHGIRLCGLAAADTSGRRHVRMVVGSGPKTAHEGSSASVRLVCAAHCLVSAARAYCQGVQHARGSAR